MTIRQKPGPLRGFLGRWIRAFTWLPSAQQRQKRKYYCKFLPSASFCKSNFPCLLFLPQLVTGRPLSGSVLSDHHKQWRRRGDSVDGNVMSPSVGRPAASACDPPRPQAAAARTLRHTHARARRFIAEGAAYLTITVNPGYTQSLASCVLLCRQCGNVNIRWNVLLCKAGLLLLDSKKISRLWVVICVLW